MMSKAAASPQREIWFPTVAIAITVLIHLVASFWPSVRVWGFDYWSDLPVWLRVAAMLTAMALLVPEVRSRIARRVEAIRFSRWQSLAALAAIVVLFIVFRSEGLSYGDGYSFRSYFPHGNLGDLSGNLRMFAGDLLAHWAVIRVAGFTPDLAYAVLSAIAGGLSLMAIVRIAAALYPKDRGTRWLVIASGCSSAMIALWFGYVEAYSLVSTALLWSLAWCIEGQNQRTKLIWAWGAWLAAVFFHLFAIVFLPVLAVATFGQQLLNAASRLKITFMLLAGFVLWGVAAVLFGLFKPEIFVPLRATAVSTYTAFSAAHLLDLLNLLIFAAPLGLIGLFAANLPARPSSTTSPGAAILGVAGFSVLFFAFWIDPLIGAFRDWDLLGSFGIPLSLWGAALLVPRWHAKGRWVAVCGLTIAHSVTFVAVLQSDSHSMMRVDRMVREDLHYSAEFHRGERLTPWAYVTAHIGKLDQVSLDHLGKRLLWQPLDRDVWRNLGSIYWNMNKLDSAAFYFEHAAQLSPNDTLVLNQLGLTYTRMQNWEGTKKVLSALSDLRGLSIEETNRLAFALIYLKDYRAADSVLEESIRRAPDQREAYYYLGTMAESRGDTARAIAHYEKAIGPNTEIEDVYMRCARLYNSRTQWSEMARIGTLWVGRFPSSADAHFMMGVGHFGMKQYEDANRQFQQSLQISPTNALATYYVAVTYRHLNQRDKANEFALRSAGIDSSLALPYLELVYLAADAGDRAAAVAATHQYLRRAPYDSGMTYLRQFMGK